MIHKRAVLIGVGVCVLGFDQLGKSQAMGRLAEGERVRLLGEFLSLAHVELIPSRIKCSVHNCSPRNQIEITQKRIELTWS